MFRKLLLLSLGWMLLLTPAAFAGEYNTPSIGAEVIDANTVRIFGTGCQPGETVSLEYGPTVETIADSNGDFSTNIDVTGLTGDLTVTATCGDLVQSIVVSLGTPGALPRTGDDSSLPLARFGAILVALGGAALYMSQKRGRETTRTEAQV